MRTPFDAGEAHIARKDSWYLFPFLTLQEARLAIEAWRREYSEERTHSTIGDVKLQEFITNYQNGAHLAQDVTPSALV